MVGKNNQRVLRQKQGSKNYTYGLRKLSIGVASVAVSAFIGFSGAESVFAVETSDTPNQTLLSSQSGAANASETGKMTETETSDIVQDAADTKSSEAMVIDAVTDNTEIEADNKKQVPVEAEEVAQSPKIRAASNPNNAEEAIDDFNKQEQDNGPSEEQISLGAIDEVKQLDDGLFEVDYETGQQGRLYFYDDNIVRYYVDPTGKFEDPAPRDETRPADIVVPEFDSIEKVKVSLKDSEEQASLVTDAMSVQLDKKKRYTQTLK
ncbi:MAG: YSIRK-type signal peptide-containing protein [Aerococcus sp.]|nr:YSIRK-type signal peptide-containing protein [Aerococcus sp.]